MYTALPKNEKEFFKLQVFVRMWRNKNPGALLVGL